MKFSSKETVFNNPLSRSSLVAQWVKDLALPRLSQKEVEKKIHGLCAHHFRVTWFDSSNLTILAQVLQPQPPQTLYKHYSSNVQRAESSLSDLAGCYPAMEMFAKWQRGLCCKVPPTRGLGIEDLSVSPLSFPASFHPSWL